MMHADEFSDMNMPSEEDTLWHKHLKFILKEIDNVSHSFSFYYEDDFCSKKAFLKEPFFFLFSSEGRSNSINRSRIFVPTSLSVDISKPKLNLLRRNEKKGFPKLGDESESWYKVWDSRKKPNWNYNLSLDNNFRRQVIKKVLEIYEDVYYHKAYEDKEEIDRHCKANNVVKEISNSNWE